VSKHTGRTRGDYPPCPKCGSDQTRAGSPTAKGRPRVFCLDCGKSTVIGGATGAKTRNKGGEYATVSHTLSPEVVEALSSLPQVKAGEWSRSYLVEQILRVGLGMPGDYSPDDLALIVQGVIIE
jgi:hypothetical protein